MQISLNERTWNFVKSIESSEYESCSLVDPAKNQGQFWNLLLAVLNLQVLFQQH
jgi:hypothetical protein